MIETAVGRHPFVTGCEKKSPKIRIFPDWYVPVYGYNGYFDAEMLRLIFVL